MNPYANIYLMVDKQHQRDLARTFRNAQRGPSRSSSSDVPSHSEYRPVGKSRVSGALGRLRRRQSPVNPVTAVKPASAMDSRVRRVHAA